MSQDKIFNIGRFKQTTVEEVDARAGRGYLTTFLQRNRDKPYLGEIVKAIDEYIENNPIKRSKPLGVINQSVRARMTLKEAEWKETNDGDNSKTIKHVFQTEDGDIVLVYSTKQAIASVNINDSVVISGLVSKVVPVKHRGLEDDKATILKSIYVEV